MIVVIILTLLALICTVVLSKIVIKYSKEDLKNAYNQGRFDGNSIAQSMHKEHKSYKDFDDYFTNKIEKI